MRHGRSVAGLLAFAVFLFAGIHAMGGGLPPVPRGGGSFEGCENAPGATRAAP